jgi:hypothetical protein
MTPARQARKPRLAERRQQRIEASAERQQRHIAARLAEAETPLDLLARAYEVLRGRLVQSERKALAAVERADTPARKQRAAARLAGVRAEIERVCGDAAGELARLTDEIHTERR